MSIRADASGLPGLALPNADVSLAPTKVIDGPCCQPADYLFTLPTPLTLTAGTYWIAVQTDNGSGLPIWGWQVNDLVGASPAYSDDNGATWGSLGLGYDFTFAVFGTVRFNQTITVSPVTPNPAPLGSTASVSATASSKLTVAIAAGPANVCTLNGTTLSFVGLGICTVTANQSGNDNYFPAPEVTRDIVVVKVSQAITFPAITPNPATVLSSATLGATVSSGLGVKYSSLTPDVCTVNGSAVSYISTGTCTVAADEAGNDIYDPAAQATQSVNVVKMTQAITVTSAAPAPGYINGTYPVGATGGASGNPVRITVGPPNVCTVSSNTVRFVGVGTCTVTANQAGTNAYDAATPVSQSVKVDYHYLGFLDPVKNGVMNASNAGNSIPLKWRLTDVDGAPITTLASARIVVKELNCTLGATGAQVAEQAISGSALQNLGGGYYQVNWKSPAAYAKSCKTLQLDLGEGSGARTAAFAFTK
ncbi:MAG: PxKF domain-containing protein [Acidobacteria bacterium]|nr:PxKF domain-containing protein [Acidobacteriota bacterium]